MGAGLLSALNHIQRMPRARQLQARVLQRVSVLESYFVIQSQPPFAVTSQEVVNQAPARSGDTSTPAIFSDGSSNFSSHFGSRTSRAPARRFKICRRAVNAAAICGAARA